MEYRMQVYLQHMIYPEKTVGSVKPKKHFGQHFLTKREIAQKIVAATADQQGTIVEIGAGTGALTKFLLHNRQRKLWAVELDRESCTFLRTRYPQLHDQLIEGDILHLDWSVFGEKIHIVGNFPYCIASQILFKVLDHHDQVSTVTCMIQKEVAKRIAASQNSKAYGILSVFLQAYYDTSLLFDVPPDAFHPRPKVMSTVIQLKRNNRKQLNCHEHLFRKVVKAGFQNRRKISRNALKKLNLPDAPATEVLLKKRAEQLSIADFIYLTQELEKKHNEADQI